MSIIRTFACAGALVAATLAAHAAEPTLVWTMGAGMPSGQMVLMGQPNGGSIESATLIFNFDSGQVDTPVAKDVGLYTGWQGNYTRLGANSIRLDVFNNAGQTANGPVLAITFRHKQTGFHAATVTLSGSSNIVMGEDSDGFPGPFAIDQQPAAFVYGVARKVGRYAPSAVTMGEDHGTPIAAAAVDDRLLVLDPASADLADRPNWVGGKSISDSISHRPAFGEISGALIVAAGTDSGRGLVYRVSDGAALSDITVGYMAAGTPAVAGTKGDIYWPALTPDGPVVVHQRVGGGTDSVSLGDASDVIVSSPAVWNNLLVIGSQSTAWGFRTDPETGVITPQAEGTLTGDDFGGAPVLVNGMGYIAGSSGKVYRVNLQTGAPDGTATLPASAAPLSNPFHDAAHAAVLFGGADGTLYRVSTTDLAITPISVSTSSLYSPVALNGLAYVSDSAGNLSTVSGAPGGNAEVSLQSGLSPALGIIRGTPNRIIQNTTDGFLLAIPAS